MTSIFTVEIQVTSNYQELFDLLRSPPAGNIDILYYFISSNIHGNILYNHESKKHTTLRSFEKNNVLILYSSFASETFQEELLLLKRLHNITNTKFGYKIVWVLIDVQKRPPPMISTRRSSPKCHIAIHLRLRQYSM